MRKPELAAAIANKTGLSKSKANEVITALADEITEAVALNQAVTLPGLGRFVLRERQARIGTDPRSGAPLQISARKTVSFKASKALKDALNSPL